MNGDLAEGYACGSLAGELVVGQACQPQMAQRQGTQVMRLAAFQQVGGEQGVGDDAAQLDAVIGQHMAIVFEVLSQFGACGVFQPGLEQGQCRLPVRLVGDTGVVVRQRQIGGTRAAGVGDGEGQAHQLRGQRVE